MCFVLLFPEKNTAQRFFSLFGMTFGNAWGVKGGAQNGGFPLKPTLINVTHLHIPFVPFALPPNDTGIRSRSCPDS